MLILVYFWINKGYKRNSGKTLNKKGQFEYVLGGIWGYNRSEKGKGIAGWYFLAGK
jgi:hypothetical protein